MIGQDRIPDGLTAGRLHRSAAVESWRDGWDRFDDVAMAWLTAINDVNKSHALEPVEVASFRSNRGEVSILREADHWVVAWDERFFDYLIVQLQLLHYTSPELAKPHLYMLLLNFVGESCAITDPCYAVTLWHEAARYRRDTAKLRIDSRFDAIVKSHYRMMRQFILAHEVGHAIIKQPEARKIERQNFSTVANILRESLKDANFLASPRLRFYSGGDLSPREFAKEMLEAAEGGDHSEELLSDFFAVRSVMDTEIAILEKQGIARADEQTGYVLALIYQSIRLLFLMTATMNKVHEWLQPKSIIYSIGPDQFKSIAALEVRHDMRGYLWNLYAEQVRPRDTRTQKRINAQVRIACDQYMNIQMPIFADFMHTFYNRGRLLRQANDLRNAQRRAQELYGYGSG
jgi:hypothetical protein